MKFTIAAFAMIGLASAHNMVTSFHINGTPNSDCVRLATSTNPITDVASNNMACNAVKGNGKSKCIVKGGDSIAFEWRVDPGIPAAEYPLKGGTIPVGVTDDSHKGPCAIYMKKVDDALTAAGPGDGWFKVSEDGLDAAGTFCTDRLRLANAPQPGVIPKNIPSGDYLIRAELLTLNNAGPASIGGQEQPQFYVGCVQITVEGTSGSPNVEKVTIPGYLTKSSPGLIFDIWNSKTYSNYPMPGPKPLTGSTNSSLAPAVSSSPAAISSLPAAVKTSTASISKNTTTVDSPTKGGNPAPAPTTPGMTKPTGKTVATKTLDPTTFVTMTATGNQDPEQASGTPLESDAPSPTPTGVCYGWRRKCRQHESSSDSD
ncbi:hypothetical protein L873DRAFT_1821144 [Choiromyces venosus 120613-1]|uniref:AA9 family lytic polysaccharide monooxygenase n=1 Tax=Choiromyces venosus 120613-1 TaxID=1336337 RepID=A0A3N4J9C9_9PEZI|nr:hypothetical protein L873DRAFT_1821144 [Choiromyces venosus 120613-1]